MKDFVRVFRPTADEQYRYGNRRHSVDQDTMDRIHTIVALAFVAGALFGATIALIGVPV